MHPDDDSQTTLSKWPFILGDVLLVATGLAIAMLGGWQLTDWQVGACVAAVALGAALFVLPYVVEYYVRVRESQEDRAADLRLLEKHILKAEQELGAIQSRLRGMERETAEALQSQADSLAVIDAKLAQIESAGSDQEAVLQERQNELQERQNELQEKLKEVPPAFDPKVLEQFEARLQVLEERPVPQAPEPASEPAAKAPASEQEAATSVEETATSEEKSPTPEEKAPTSGQEPVPEPPTQSVSPIERPKRFARERRGPEESRLLQRAISDKGDHSSTAVSRIIAAKSTAQKVVKLKEPETEPQEPETEPQEPEATASEHPQASEAKGPHPQVEADPLADAPEVADADMLFDADKIAAPLPRTKARKHDAVVTASVFIGIGNKPYLRGSGGGLSWEQGQVMEFEEIGKWRWVAPSELEAAIEVQLFRNDDDPDKSGKYTLEPGQKLEVSPVF